MTTISYDLLKLQNSSTTTALIAGFTDSETFKTFAAKQTAGILKRDQEDDEKLAEGIQLAIDKKVLPAKIDVEPIKKIDVYNKSAEQVADEIIGHLGDAVKTGFAMTLEGLSGTGKGTTVAMLKDKINAVTWSNGNVFRCITLLAVKYAEQNNCELNEVLTPENLADFFNMIKFGKFNGQFDVAIDGLGVKAYVADIQNTDLKQSSIGKNIPTVAGVTQGEVINFVQDCLKQLVEAGNNVLLEGRGATLNYIRTPHRFELILSDQQIIGQRRAAQMLMASALKKLDAGAADDVVKAALDTELEVLSKQE